MTARLDLGTYLSPVQPLIFLSTILVGFSILSRSSKYLIFGSSLWPFRSQRWYPWNRDSSLEVCISGLLSRTLRVMKDGSTCANMSPLSLHRYQCDPRTAMQGAVIPAFLLILLFPFLYLNILAKASAQSRRIIYRWPTAFACMYGPIAIHSIY